MFFHQPGQHSVRLIINKYSSRLDLIQKNAKLLQVNIETGKNIYMIPGNSSENRNMREKKMKLRSLFEGTGRIFITLADDQRRPGNIHRLGKLLQPGPDQIIQIQ